MGLSIMLFKHNDDRRHHIPKSRLRVTNWRQYEVGLRRRGSLTRCRQAAKAAAVGRRLRSSRVGATLAPGGLLGWAVRKNVHSIRQRSPLRWLLQERPPCARAAL